VAIVGLIGALVYFLRIRATKGVGMIRALITGLPVMVLCLLLQSVFITRALKHYAQYRNSHALYGKEVSGFWMIAVVMLLLMINSLAQIVIWAILFRLLQEFPDFSIALYHSGVNFTTLGYGDIVMSSRWRLLGPLEAAHCILMFWISTAVMTATVADLIKIYLAKEQE
jgi:voltage-gated potassium channel Kch